MAKYTVLQVASAWDEVAGAWVEADRTFLGEVVMPLTKPVESKEFAAFMDNQEIPMLIYTELNDYGHRTIDVETEDGQKAFQLVCHEAEDDGPKEDGYGGTK